MKRHEPEVLLGTGTYGHPVSKPMNLMKKNVLIVGTTRTGKTRLANSIARQQSHELGCGQLILNFKPEPGFVAEKARDAHRMGRSFLHFTMAPKGGGGFVRSHPYEPPVPCNYDPLDRSNGATRARMLIDSVAHDDASDVYRRNAIEVTALAWDIAAITGYDYQTMRNPDTGQATVRRRRSLQVLLELLDMNLLEQQAQLMNPELLQRLHPHLGTAEAESKVAELRSRALSIKEDSNHRASVMSSAIADTRSIVSSFLNSSAFYPQSLASGNRPALRIDIMRAIVRGEIVLFSLSAADYQQEAAMLGSMILLDLQNTVSTLREYQSHAKVSGQPDATPWPPLIVQIEELGTAANPASAKALIGLLNKSADVGIRPVTSTQSLSDIRGIGDGTYLQRVIALTDDLISLQLGESVDDEEISRFSGSVTKKIATAETEVSNNRWSLFTGARQARTVRPKDTEMPRIPVGTVQSLRSSDEDDVREMVWTSKTPALRSVHTHGPEGPNNWHETIEMVPVGEPPLGYDPFEDPDSVAETAAAAAQAARALGNDMADATSMLHKLHQLSNTKLKSIGDIPTHFTELEEPILDVSITDPADIDVPLPPEPDAEPEPAHKSEVIPEANKSHTTSQKRSPSTLPTPPAPTSESNPFARSTPAPRPPVADDMDDF